MWAGIHPGSARSRTSSRAIAAANPCSACDRLDQAELRRIAPLQPQRALIEVDRRQPRVERDAGAQVGDAEIERPERGGLGAAGESRGEVAQRAMEQTADMPEPRIARMAARAAASVASAASSPPVSSAAMPAR